jgi:hypothetical protein
VGNSGFSNEVVIRAAKVPDTPSNIVTSVNLTNILVSWTLPYNGGSPIIGYSVMIRTSDGLTYSADTSNCNNVLVATTLSTNKCNVPFTLLYAAPFNLPWGSSIYAIVAL